MLSLRKRLGLVFFALVMVFTVAGCITINVGDGGSAGSKPSVKAIVNACRDTYQGCFERSYFLEVQTRTTI